MPNIAFIGLGTMGTPMAKRLINSEFKLSIFDISKNVLSKFEAIFVGYSNDSSRIFYC